MSAAAIPDMIMLKHVTTCRYRVHKQRVHTAGAHERDGALPWRCLLQPLAGPAWALRALRPLFPFAGSGAASAAALRCVWLGRSRPGAKAGVSRQLGAGAIPGAPAVT